MLTLGSRNTCRTLSNVHGAVQFGHFNFDFVHDQNCGQEDVFYTTVRPLVHKLVEVYTLPPGLQPFHNIVVSLLSLLSKLVLTVAHPHLFVLPAVLKYVPWQQGKSSTILLYGASKTGKTYTAEVSKLQLLTIVGIILT